MRLNNNLSWLAVRIFFVGKYVLIKRLQSNIKCVNAVPNILLGQKYGARVKAKKLNAQINFIAMELSGGLVIGILSGSVQNVSTL